MKKHCAVLFLLAAVAVSVMAFSGRSSGAPAPNLADYPYVDMSLFHPTTLKASACANNAQDALKRSGYGHIGSSGPGYTLFGTQGAYLAGVGWDAERQVYYYVVAGPDRETVLSNFAALKSNASALFEK